MGLFGTGFFDIATGGQWTEASACGLNKECKAAKNTISTVCAPLRSIYGENVYQSCVTMAQREPRPAGASDVLCTNPQTAWEVYRFNCEGYTAPPSPEAVGTIQIGDKKINMFYILGAVLLLVILFIIYKKYIV